jgi:hypothetical protein
VLEAYIVLSTDIVLVADAVLAREGFAFVQ